MAKIKVHPGDSMLFCYWDIATSSVLAFWTDPSSGESWDWNRDFECPTVYQEITNSAPWYKDTVTGKIVKHWKNHLLITEGKIHYFSDCTHMLAGQIVDMLDFPEDYFDRYMEFIN